MNANSTDPYRLDGKVALVTGAGRADGLGAAIAAALVAGGAKVLITDINPQGETVAAQLGASSAFVKQDVTLEADWERAMSAVLERFGGLDIVVNNAGIELAGFFADMSVEDFRRQMDVNTTSVFLGIKHAIRAMRPGGAAGRGGAIVNLSSIGGIKGAAGLGAYCGSKGAVRLMTKAAAVECARHGYGIRVNSVHPGLIKTDMGIQTLKAYVRLGLLPDEDVAEKAVASRYPLGLGSVADVANAVRYLSSEAGRWQTGAELVVDGGVNA